MVNVGTIDHRAINHAIASQFLNIGVSWSRETSDKEVVGAECVRYIVETGQSTSR